MHTLRQLGDGVQLVEQASGQNVAILAKHGTIARTDTTAKNLFTIPAGAVVTGTRLFAGTASNAATTATVSIGKTGTTNRYLNAADVKTSAGLVSGTAAQNTNLYTVESATAETQIVGIYAETGTASTTGGPWTVELSYYVP